MKSATPYILIAAIIVLLGILILTNRSKTNRILDERITLRQKDKIPYGMSVARILLPQLFPSAYVHFENSEPGYWNNINSPDSSQAVIFVANYFDADPDELRRLSDFIHHGNYVFIIAHSFSYDVTKFFQFDDDPYLINQFQENYGEDSLKVQLSDSIFHKDTVFTYPGRRFAGAFSSLDTLHTIVLGRNEHAWPDFIQMDQGKGSFFIHTAPLAFSNYFILHKDNVRYYENAFSVIPKKVRTIVWDEYYLLKPQKNNEKEPGWLSIMLQHEPFRYGFFTAIGVLALFVLLNSRRRQRMIPGHERPKNDSLDFVKTLGRLYYDKRDHKNLAIKMSQYFLEHVRAKYKLSTQYLDSNFEEMLQFKSGYPAHELKRIISFIYNLESEPVISEGQLSDFHQQLELFYQNT